MILLSRSWGVSFFSPSFKGPPEELALVNFASADDVLTDGFTALLLFSLSSVMPDAGSICNASSIRPDDGLHESTGVRHAHFKSFMHIF